MPYWHPAPPSVSIRTWPVQTLVAFRLKSKLAEIRVFLVEYVKIHPLWVMFIDSLSCKTMVTSKYMMFCEICENTCLKATYSQALVLSLFFQHVISFPPFPFFFPLEKGSAHKTARQIAIFRCGRKSPLKPHRCGNYASIQNTCRMSSVFRSRALVIMTD